MVSPLPVSRSREENQERAFIAASRRKDRKLDARVESANRASVLHKKRTGKPLHITRELVEKEAIYEEAHEKHQEKYTHLLEDQNKADKEQLSRHLLAVLAARVSSMSSIGSTSVRNSFLGPLVSAGDDFQSKERLGRLCSDSYIDPTVDMISFTSPVVSADGYTIPIITGFNSYSPRNNDCMHCPHESQSFFVEAAFANTTTHALPFKGNSTYAEQEWMSRMSPGAQSGPSWPILQFIPTPNRPTRHMGNMLLLQEMMIMRAETYIDTTMPVPVQQLGHDVWPTPEFQFQHLNQQTAAIATASGKCYGNIDICGQNRVNNNAIHLRTLNQDTFLAHSPWASHLTSSIDGNFNETDRTLAVCSTPNLPTSPPATATPQAEVAYNYENWARNISHETMNTKLSEFVQVSSDLTNPRIEQDAENFFEEFVALDRLASNHFLSDPAAAGPGWLPLS